MESETAECSHCRKLKLNAALHAELFTLHPTRSSSNLLVCLLNLLVLFLDAHTNTHMVLKAEEPLTRTWAQRVSWVLLTLLLLAPRGIEAWLPPTRRPQALKPDTCKSFQGCTKHYPSSSSSSLLYSYLWFCTSTSVNSWDCASPLWFKKKDLFHLSHHFPFLSFSVSFLIFTCFSP